MSAMTPESVRPAKKTILIVDDHHILRRGLAALINFESDLTVCGEAANHAAALVAIREQQPDLVIVDLSLGGRDGLDLVKDIKLRHPKVPALVLTMHDESVYAERCLRAGACGYVTKQQLEESVLSAIRCVLKGEIYISDQLKGRLAAKYVDRRAQELIDTPVETLSNRELQVFRLIGEGRSTRQIAEHLSLSIKTIETHREHIKNKLNIDSSAMLAQQAVRWIELGRIWTG